MGGSNHFLYKHSCPFSACAFATRALIELILEEYHIRGDKSCPYLVESDISYSIVDIVDKRRVVRVEVDIFAMREGGKYVE